MDTMSALAELLFGVPQRSVLGPLLFILYVLPLSDLVRRYDVSMYRYVYDTQLYISFDHKDLSRVNKEVKSLECCIADIRSWILRNRLTTNDSKTDMMVSVYPRVELPVLRIVAATDSHQPVGEVRNFGVTLDVTLPIETHKSERIKFCIFS